MRNIKKGKTEQDDKSTYGNNIHTVGYPVPKTRHIQSYFPVLYLSTFIVGQSSCQRIPAQTDPYQPCSACGSPERLPAFFLQDSNTGFLVRIRLYHTPLANGRIGIDRLPLPEETLCFRHDAPHNHRGVGKGKK